MYTDAHRSFLQLLMDKRILTARQVNAAFEAACAKYEVDPQTTGGLQKFVMDINAAISPLHVSIKKSVQEDLRADKSCFVLINTHSTEATKSVSTLTQWEENLFDHIIQAIVTSEDGFISEVAAVNVGPTLTSHRVSISDSEAAVGRMVKTMLLNKDGDSVLLSALTLSEQQQQLENNYPELCVKCHMCGTITIQGHSCEGCNIRVHRGCGMKVWRQTKRDPFCPSCKTLWPFVRVSNSQGGRQSQ